MTPEAPPKLSTPEDAARVARWGLWVLAGGLGGFLLWAALAPLDEGVPSPALVAVETQRQAVQHLSGGVVSEVLVREGQEVRLGQVLFRIDPSLARANHETVRQRYLGMRATQARLAAELGGHNRLALHPDLESNLTDPLIRAQVDTQQALLSSRRQALEAERRAIEEAILGQRSLAESMVAMRRSRESQRDLLREELRNTRSLAIDGYAPRNRVLELERQLADLDASVADLVGRQEQAQRSIAELQQRVALRQLEFNKEAQAQLTSVTQDVQADADRLQALRADLQRTDIVSPATGQAVGVVVQTVGAVIQPGQKLMDVVPREAKLLLDVRIAPHLIDKVGPNLETDVRFSTFAHSPQLVVPGRVQSVSQDLLTDTATGTSYYLARVALTDEGMSILGSRRLQAGMPAEVLIKTGERSLLTYLLSPLVRRIAASMKEE